MEELVAEIGAAFLCADLGITPETRDDHAAYIASWLKVLKDDKRAIFTAASHAQKVADYLPGLPPQEAQAMTRAPFIVIDGKLYRWKDILELRRAQLAAAEAAQASQLALFAALHDDRRPPAERTASGRYLEPGFFANKAARTRKVIHDRLRSGPSAETSAKSRAALRAGAETAPRRGSGLLSLPLSRRVRVEDFRGKTRFNRIGAYATSKRGQGIASTAHKSDMSRSYLLARPRNQARSFLRMRGVLFCFFQRGACHTAWKINTRSFTRPVMMANRPSYRSFPSPEVTIFPFIAYGNGET